MCARAHTRTYTYGVCTTNTNCNTSKCLYPWDIKLGGATTKIIWHNHKQGQASHHCSTKPPNIYGGKAISNKYVLSFLWKVALGSDDLIGIGSWFQIVGAATEKAHLPILNLVFRQKSCLEIDDLRVLWISEKCSRLTKYIDCWVERVRYITVANLIWYTIGSQCNCLSSNSDDKKQGPYVLRMLNNSVYIRG